MLKFGIKPENIIVDPGIGFPRIPMEILPY